MSNEEGQNQRTEEDEMERERLMGALGHFLIYQRPWVPTGINSNIKDTVDSMIRMGILPEALKLKKEEFRDHLKKYDIDIERIIEDAVHKEYQRRWDS